MSSCERTFRSKAEQCQVGSSSPCQLIRHDKIETLTRKYISTHLSLRLKILELLSFGRKRQNYSNYSTERVQS